MILIIIDIPSIYYGWYLYWSWVDIFLHFAGGFFVALFMADYLKNHFLAGKLIQNILIIVGATVFIGVIWEFAEHLANQTLIEPAQKYLDVNAYFMGDLQDTVLDLLMDILGALTLCPFIFLSKNSPKEKSDSVQHINP